MTQPTDTDRLNWLLYQPLAQLWFADKYHKGELVTRADIDEAMREGVMESAQKRQQFPPASLE